MVKSRRNEVRVGDSINSNNRGGHRNNFRGDGTREACPICSAFA